MSKNSMLFSTTAFAAILLSGAAQAQALATAAEPTGLEQVVVTATRQVDTVNRVALSISASTQKTLDQQGVRYFSDLTKTVPALTIVGGVAGNATFAIRGIVGTVGAATTGVYLDDTSLTKRTNSGGSNLAGAPIPLLFDLERVEVLKGPQGTLYGGSSQGGTIRFITPAPSLTTRSGMLRADVNHISHGGESLELAGAIGGPIVQDKVGFRVSAIMRNTAGWIDRVSGYQPGRVVIDKDANERKEWAIRGALLWQFSDNFGATLTGYHSDSKSPGGSDASTVVYGVNGAPAAAGQTYTTPALCFNNNGRAPTSGAAPAAVACPTGPLPAGFFQRQSFTYGPYNLGMYASLSPYEQRGVGNNTENTIIALTIDASVGAFDLKSITSLLYDKTHGLSAEGYDILRTQPTVENPGRIGFPLWAAEPNYAGLFDSYNIRNGVSQEFRVSTASDRRLAFVGGLYLSSATIKNDWHVRGQYDRTYLQFFGLTASQRYAGQTAAQPNVMSELHARLTDKEVAGFGEVTFRLIGNLKLTGGLRVSRTVFNYQQSNFGFYNVGRPRIDSPGAVIDGSTKATPITPKFGAQYEFSPNKMVYANVAKGYRPGGLNAPLNPACASGLALYGLTVNDIALAYGPDTVWSYETGGKFRMMDNRLQVNVAAFKIDWSNIQTTQVVAGCPGWNQNGGSASSKGFDFQAEFKPIRPLLITLAFGHTNAKYSEDVLGPQGNGQKVVAFNAGDPIGVPTWQGTLGVRYDFEVGSFPAFLRADYQYQAPYLRGSSFGTITYQLSNRKVKEEDTLNARAGVTVQDVEINLYSTNVLGSKDMVGAGGNGRASCLAAGGVACTAYGSFNPLVQQQFVRPRVVGVQATYRF